MADEPIAPAIPWYSSPVQIAQTASAISTFVALFPKSQIVLALGLSDPTVVTNDVTYAFGTCAFIAAVIGMIARSRSKIQPVTLTQKKADEHPNTIAANAAVAAEVKK